MKQKIFVLLLLFCTHLAIAQTDIGVRVFFENPSDDHPEIFDNSIGGELIFKKSFREQGRLVARGGVTFLSRNFRFDSYPDYVIVEDRGEFTAVESEINLERYQEYFFALGLNLILLNRDDFKLYVGGDGLLGRYEFTYESFFEGFSQGDKAETGNLAGYRLRFGADYILNDNFIFTASSHWGKRSITAIDYYSLFDFGIGVAYRIE